MHSHRSSPDRFPTAAEPMRDDDVRRMLAAREQQSQRASRPRSRRILLRVTILLTLYILSIGPLYWRWYGAKAGLDSRLFLVFYGPLETLAKWIPPLGHFLNWYISLWIY
jgi:hypothetical protein